MTPDSQGRWAAILKVLHEMASNHSVPLAQRARYRELEDTWTKIPERERGAAMDAFLEQLASDVVAKIATGREQKDKLRPPRGGGGALPVPDDTPSAPPRRRRKA